MNMKNNIKRLVLAGILATSLTAPSCNKYLDLEPKNSTYDEVFWVNGANVSKALSGAYSLLRDAFRDTRSYFIFGDIAGGNLAVGGDYWNYNTLVESGNFRFSYAPYLESAVHNWSRFYSIINQCHLIIENTPNIDVSSFSGGEVQRNRIEGEARFLRAYVYFYLQRVWGDVILTREALKDPQNVPELGRVPQEETLTFCKDDLLKAIELLDNGEPVTVANRSAAQALLAHIYAWEHDYSNAETYANEVITTGGFALEDVENYLQIWNGHSEESIFELNMLYDAISNEGTSGFFNIFLTDPYIRSRSLNSAWPLSSEVLNNLFVEDEARADTIIKVAAGGGSSRILAKYMGVDYYDANNPNTYVVSNNLVLMRLADIYLLRAESRFKNGNESGALADLNLIRNRAKLASYSGSGDDLFNEIFDERRRELIGEGCTAFDMIRMEQHQRLYPTIYSSDRIAQQGYFWPLAMRTLLPQAPLLTQNEWWKSH